MDLLNLLASKAAGMIGNAVRTAWRRLRTPPDPRGLQFEALYADLSEPARIALWYFCDSSMLPHVLAARLRDARLSVDVDAIIRELSDADLIDHDFAGNRYIKPEWAAYVRTAMRRRR